ncbi:MAG: H-NS histone family protein [Pseudomonadota bacterium]
MSIDLANLSVSELQNLQKELSNQFKTRQSQNLKEARAAIKEVEARYGFTAEEILASKKKVSASEKNTVDAKFRNPENSEETWTGRGKKPKWVETALKAGKNIDDLKI